MSGEQTFGQDTIDEFVAAAHFDLPKVQTMLAEHPDMLNENATWIETAIQAAAHVGNRDIAEYLLGQGAPLDICTAAMLGQAEDVDALVTEYPELVEATGAHNIPVLYYPAIGGHLNIAERLVSAGADVNAGEGKNTPLHGAAFYGQDAVARWLLDHDANPYAKDFNGAYPVELAEKQGHTAIVEMLRPFTQTE